MTWICFSLYMGFRITWGFRVIRTNWPSGVRLTLWSWTLISVNRKLFWDFALLLGFSTCKKVSFVIVLPQSVICGKNGQQSVFRWVWRSKMLGFVKRMSGDFRDPSVNFPYFYNLLHLIYQLILLKYYLNSYYYNLELDMIESLKILLSLFLCYF
jgi:hypothetical protein